MNKPLESAIPHVRKAQVYEEAPKHGMHGARIRFQKMESDVVARPSTVQSSCMSASIVIF
jgi:hypothetical protein